MGQFELHLNGKKVGEDVLEPGWTNYRKTCLYRQYDLTSQITQGGHSLGVMLGNGMYNATRGRYMKFTGSFGQPKLIAHLHIEYADGSSQTVATDDTWRVADGPVVFSSVFGGEDYDARLEQPGWDRAGFNNSKWQPATVGVSPGGRLTG